jgi:hypothetical protein
MIDEEWLKELRFDMPGIGTVTGLAGVGSQFVVLTYTDLEGQKMVIKHPRRSLAWHLNEVPKDFGWEAGHSIDRVNRKLLAAIGSPIIDENCFIYNQLFNMALGQLLKESLLEWLSQARAPRDYVDPLAYIVQTDVFFRRMQDILSSNVKSQFDSVGKEFFGTMFPVDTIPRVAEMLQDVKTLSTVEDMVTLRQDLAPDMVSRNPLFVWGAAVLEGIIHENEYEVTAAFVKDRFPEMQHPTNTLAMQGSDWYDVLFRYVDSEANECMCLAKFAKHFGFIYKFDAPPRSKWKNLWYRALRWQTHWRIS